MALRFASKFQFVPGTTGLVVAHGLGSTPDEFFLSQTGASAVFFSAASNPDVTNVYLSSGNVGAGGTASVFAVTNHSVIK